MSLLDESLNKSIKCVLTDLDLSINVSVPTSIREIWDKDILFFLINLSRTVKHIEFISSLSSTKDMLVCPKPIVYLPWGILSYSSNSY